MAGGIRMPGSTSGLFDPKIVEQLIEVEKMPVEAAKKRKEKVVTEKKEFDQIQGMLSGLDGTLNKLKTKTDFYKMKVESSHPDIIDGMVANYAMPGSYEFEVRGMAKSDKKLAYGFPDKDTTPVGFGYMYIEREDQEGFDVIVEPGATLQDVATLINDQDAGVKAMVINTKYKPDPYRLLVISEQSGQEAKVTIDEDTTYLEFKEQVTGRNLDVLFEDVPVTDETNSLKELVDGIVFNVKRSEPGTRVQVNIAHDVDATAENIKVFVEQYNQVADFINKQFVVDPETKRAGVLSGDSSIKTIIRQLQGAIAGATRTGGKFSTLADIGITTDPKSGKLNLDESTVKQSLAEDYDSVARLFIRSKDSEGVAEKLAQQIRGFRDPISGTLKARQRGLETLIQNSDKEIGRKEDIMKQKEESIRRRFTNLESNLSGMKAQKDFLAAKMAGDKAG